MKIKGKYSFYSNILFLVPAYFAFRTGMQSFGICIMLVFLGSMFFHATKPTGFIWWWDTGRLNPLQSFTFWADTILALMLVFYNLYVFWQKGFPSMFWHAIILAVIALYIFFFKAKRKEYDFYHGVWHIFAATITLLVIFA